MLLGGGRITKTTGVIDKSIRKRGKKDQTINCIKSEWVSTRAKSLTSEPGICHVKINQVQILKYLSWKM